MWMPFDSLVSLFSLSWWFPQSVTLVVDSDDISLVPRILLRKMAFPSTTPNHDNRPRLLSCLPGKRKPIMTFLGLPSFRAAQIIAQTGFEVQMVMRVLPAARLTATKGIIIDCEHGAIGDESMHSCTAAIAALGVSPLVRLRMTHPDLIKRALDTGAQ